MTAAQGWAWIVGGFRLFMRSPAMWIVLLLILYAAKKTAYLIPSMFLAAILSLIVVLLVPVFLVGLMDGCRALEEGRDLEIGHLLGGFRRNAAHLVTIGGLSLVANLAIAMLTVLLAGDAMSAMMKTMSENPTITPQIAEKMQAEIAAIGTASLVAATLSMPLLMALWFAPLLIFFHDVRPFDALKLSFVACLRNTLPMLVYGLVLLAALVVLVPIGIALREYDLGLWLMAPVLIPSVYASYRDIFATQDGLPRAPAAQPLR